MRCGGFPHSASNAITFAPLREHENMRAGLTMNIYIYISDYLFRHGKTPSGGLGKSISKTTSAGKHAKSTSYVVAVT